MASAATTCSKRRPPEADVYEPAWIIGRVRAAGPLAVALLGHGLADEDGDLVGRLQAFAGDEAGISLVNEADFTRIVNWMTQAFAVGIAVGQRLQPGAFNAGGGGR